MAAPNTPAAEWWGWNEIPVDRRSIGDQQNWEGGADDAIGCLVQDAQWRLETTLQKWVDAGYLKPGLEHKDDKPGSYVVFAREFWVDNGTPRGSWFRFFFCDYWMSPGNIFEIVSYPMGN